MSTPTGPDQPRAYPPQQPYIYQQPPGPDQLPPYSAGEYGGPPYGGYPVTAPPVRPTNRTPLIIAAVAAVVVALAVVGIVVATNGDDDEKQGAQPPASVSAPAPKSAVSLPASSTSPAPTSAPASPSGTLSPTTVPQITVQPVVPGWHGVLSYKDGVAYDVPPDWKVETPGTLVGFEDSGGQPIAVIHGVTTYKDDACAGVSGSYRGHTGFKTTGNVDPTTAARTGLQTFTESIALKKDGSSAKITGSALQDITVDQGRIRAKYARATVAVNGSKADCGSPTVAVVAVAFRSSATTTALFIGYFDQGVSDALSLATASKIFTTLRPYQR